jgi:uncharacterized membrane protein YkvA (DUF1232 family)
MTDYSGHYTDQSFWKKIIRFIAKVPFGRDAIAMFFTLKDKDTPNWVRGVIIGALGYFILTLDVIPDLLPGGFLDDAAVLAAALKTVQPYMKDAHYAKADAIINGETEPVVVEVIEE